MPSPTPSAVLDAAVDAGLEGLAAATATSEQKAALVDVHDTLMVETLYLDEAPIEALGRLSDGVGEVPAAVVDSLPMRVRVAMRLLRAKAFVAAWVVISDTATGRVEPPPQDAPPTVRGIVGRTDLPLTTRTEAGKVYAWLPGFRDPRYDAPAECFEMTDRVVQRSHLDAAALAKRHLHLSGWTSLAYLDTRADERVSVTMTTPDLPDVVVPARRRRRPDLVKGTGEALTRRVWAGWSADVDLNRLAVHGSASWELSVTIERDGISRTTPLSWNGAAEGSRSGQSTALRFGRPVRLVWPSKTKRLGLEIGPTWAATRKRSARTRRRVRRAPRRLARALRR